MDLLTPLKWTGIFFISVFGIYLIGRVLFAAIFRSWYEAKTSYFRRKKDASTTDKNPSN